MSKKRKLSNGQGKHAARPPPSARPQSKAGKRHAKPAAPPPKQKQPRPTNPQDDAAIVPFGPKNRILLVGEGDLSFSASLVQHHGCLHVTATVFESDAAELEAKYPDTAAANTLLVTDASPNCRVLYGVDACAKGPFRIPGRSKSRKKRKKGPLSLDEFNVAAVAGADVEKDSVDDDIWDRIVFNFPHVGGKSKDVNRQVRYNQELLVAFFDRSKQSLAPGGAIVVTVFEGEPYTLWNVRDLGRHSGLRVERSFRFRPDAYPGYHHSRTLGVVRNKKTGEVASTAWRGENRPSRCFVLVRKEEENVQIEGVSFVSRKKRKRADDDDDDNDDDQYDQDDQYGQYDEEEEQSEQDFEEEEEEEQDGAQGQPESLSDNDVGDGKEDDTNESA